MTSSDQDPKKPSTARMAAWVGAGAVGVYLLVTGIIGILTPGG